MGPFNLNEAELELLMHALGSYRYRNRSHPMSCHCVSCTLWHRIKCEWMKDQELAGGPSEGSTESQEKKKG